MGGPSQFSKRLLAFFFQIGPFVLFVLYTVLLSPAVPYAVVVVLIFLCAAQPVPVVLYAVLQIRIVLGPALLVLFVSHGVHILLSVLLVVLPVLGVFHVVLLVPNDLCAALHAFVVLCVDGRLRALYIETFGRDGDKMMHSPLLRLLS